MKLLTVVLFFTATLIVPTTTSWKIVTIPFCFFKLPFKKPTKRLNVSQFKDTISGGKDFQYYDDVSKHDTKIFAQTQSTLSAPTRSTPQRPWVKRTNLWDKIRKILVATVAGIIGISRFPSTISPSISQISETFHNDVNRWVHMLTIAIAKAQITESRSSISGDFTNRPKIEEQIRSVLTNEHLRAHSYTIVYGPNGIGKTELVDHTAIGLKGVVKILVSSATTREEIIQSLSVQLLRQGVPNLPIYALIQAVKNCGIIPTIIFDVERVISKNIDDPVLGAVRSLSKALAPYCRCIIVLAESNAVLQFGKDKREEFIYVGEMERDEAREMLQKLKTNLTEDEMDFVFSQIGTSPIDLLNLAERVSSTYSVKDYVRDVLFSAENDLVQFYHKPILEALKSHPDGVSPKYFNREMSEGVNLSVPQDVGIAMKASNAIVYRIESGKYMLMSTAHRTALKSYEHGSFKNH